MNEKTKVEAEKIQIKMAIEHLKKAYMLLSSADKLADGEHGLVAFSIKHDFTALEAFLNKLYFCYHCKKQTERDDLIHDNFHLGRLICWGCKDHLNDERDQV